MHGGAFGSGAPKKNKNALKDGHYTKERIEEYRTVGRLIRYDRLIQKKLSSGCKLSLEEIRALISELSPLSDIGDE